MIKNNLVRYLAKLQDKTIRELARDWRKSFHTVAAWHGNKRNVPLPFALKLQKKYGIPDQTFIKLIKR